MRGLKWLQEPCCSPLQRAAAVAAPTGQPELESTAIFLVWDWGGFYDHVVPPTVDENSYGLRVTVRIRVSAGRARQVLVTS
jgi:phospholipase C